MPLHHPFTPDFYKGAHRLLSIHFHPINVGSAVGRRSAAERAGSEAHIALIPLTFLIIIAVQSMRGHCRKTPHLADSPSNSLKNIDRSEPQCAAFYLALLIGSSSPTPRSTSKMRLLHPSRAANTAIAEKSHFVLNGRMDRHGIGP
jgi:hypothetical protein